MGWLPKWPVAGGESGVMNGDAADPILAGLYAFGATSFNAARAVTEMVHGATGTGTPGQGWYVDRPEGQAYLKNGYVPNTQSDSISPVPNGASETLEYALDDFAISRLRGQHRQCERGEAVHRDLAELGEPVQHHDRLHPAARRAGRVPAR